MIGHLLWETTKWTVIAVLWLAAILAVSGVLGPLA
jgi:hypothetical protein